MSTQPNANNGHTPNGDGLHEAFQEIDAIHKHMLEHDCCCEDLEALIVDLWTRLVHDDRIWNRIATQEPQDNPGAQPDAE